MADKEYIDRVALLKRLCGDDPSRMEDYYYNAIAKFPAADVVEVVRCENCKNRVMVIDLIGDPHLFCELSKNKAEVQFGDFCSYGEQKEATPCSK